MVRETKKDRKRKAEAEKLANLVEDFCSRHGTARKRVISGAIFSHSLETKAGRLEVNSAIFTPVIFCCFDEPKRALELLGEHSFLNPYSGKWNWHGNDAEVIFSEWVSAVSKILEE